MSWYQRETLVKIDKLTPPYTIVVYIDDVSQAVPRNWTPAFWLAAGVHSRHPAMPRGIVISISLQQMWPMAAQAV